MTLPAERPRRVLPDISPVAWEHPADRAALQALRSVPGFEEITRKILAFLGGERGIRLLFQANAIRAGASQFPRIWTTHVEVCTTFGWPVVPELYISQAPLFNAGAYGMDTPFIVLHTAALELLDEDELRVLLAHEMGHVISGHAFYRTVAAIFFLVGATALPGLAGIALLPVRLAFLEWSRKAELSSDRAGLLGGQDAVAAQRLFMKMAGGVRAGLPQEEPAVEPFMAQAQEYAGSSEGLDVFYKVLTTLPLSHPMHTVRAAELQRWIAGGSYDRILRGEYPRRGPGDRERPLRDDLGAAGEYYTKEAKEAVSQVVDAAKKAAGRARDAFRKAEPR